jgi:membrane protein DedA with SNARE-associated domain
MLARFIMSVESSMGYPGVALLMGIESACIPLPSEVIMPFAGSLVSTGRFTLSLIALAGAIGCVLGSIPAYYVGAYGGRPLVEKYGKYILLSHHDLDLADQLFAKHGDPIIFLARLLPVIRTFIAFPAGVVRMNMKKFIIYTFVGSLPWCYLLGYLGQKAGDNWEYLKPYFHRFDAVIGGLIVVGAIWWIWRHTRRPSVAATGT